MRTSHLEQALQERIEELERQLLVATDELHRLRRIRDQARDFAFILDQEVGA